MLNSLEIINYTEIFLQRIFPLITVIITAVKVRIKVKDVSEDWRVKNIGEKLLKSFLLHLKQILC